LDALYACEMAIGLVKDFKFRVSIVLRRLEQQNAKLGQRELGLRNVTYCYQHTVELVPIIVMKRLEIH